MERDSGGRVRGVPDEPHQARTHKRLSVYPAADGAFSPVVKTDQQDQADV